MNTESPIPELVVCYLVRNALLDMLGLWPDERAVKLANSPSEPFTTSLEPVMVEPLTPQQLRDLYSMLTPEKQREFLLLLGRVSAWEDPFLIVHELPPAESEKFSNEIFRTMFAHLYPLMLQEARKFARDNTGMSDEEFDKHFRPHVNAMLENYVHQIRELEATKIKAQRDRKSDPEIIKRNVEICDLRKQDANKWTQGRLAKHFGLSSAGSIRSILAEEEKWRRLHAEMSVNVRAHQNSAY